MCSVPTGMYIFFVIFMCATPMVCISFQIVHEKRSFFSLLCDFYFSFSFAPNKFNEHLKSTLLSFEVWLAHASIGIIVLHILLLTQSLEHTPMIHQPNFWIFYLRGSQQVIVIRHFILSITMTYTVAEQLIQSSIFFALRRRCVDCVCSFAGKSIIIFAS